MKESHWKQLRVQIYSRPDFRFWDCGSGFLWPSRWRPRGQESPSSFGYGVAHGGCAEWWPVYVPPCVCVPERESVSFLTLCPVSLALLWAQQPCSTSCPQLWAGEGSGPPVGVQMSRWQDALSSVFHRDLFIWLRETWNFQLIPLLWTVCALDIVSTEGVTLFLSPSYTQPPWVHPHAPAHQSPKAQVQCTWPAPGGSAPADRIPLSHHRPGLCAEFESH